MKLKTVNENRLGTLGIGEQLESLGNYVVERLESFSYHILENQGEAP